MISRVAHRGPDDIQMYEDDRIAIAFCRLSIVDIHGGRQPFWSEDKSILVVVNGEIYNHTLLRSELEKKHSFATKSDCEVVVHLFEEYGVAAFSRLQGMFATVIWDRHNQKLYLERDRLGIKPLYYSLTEAVVVFASELKSLITHPNCPNNMRWADLDWKPLPGQQRTPSYVDGVEYVPPGSWLSVDSKNNVAKGKYWDFLDYQATDNALASVGVDGISDQYRDLLLDCVGSHLMSDVPIGLFLSGGIDSSAVLSAANALSSKKIHCFSMVQDTTRQTGDVAVAKALTDRMDMPFYPVAFEHDSFLEQIDFDLDRFENYVWLWDTPRFDLELVFKTELHRYAKGTVHDLKVILLGSGADEFTGGYSGRIDRTWADWSGFIENWAKPAMRDGYLNVRGVPSLYSGLLSVPYAETLLPASAWSAYQLDMQIRVNTLAWHNLWLEDRASAGVSIEGRVPFLDHTLIEFLASIPIEYQQDLFWDKAIVRRALHAWDPQYPANHQKVSFIYTDKPGPVYLLWQEVVKRVYPGFRERYLLDDTPVFWPPALEKLYRLSTEQPAEKAERLADLLMSCIAISIFDRFLRKREPPENWNDFMHEPTRLQLVS